MYCSSCISVLPIVKLFYLSGILPTSKLSIIAVLFQILSGGTDSHIYEWGLDEHLITKVPVSATSVFSIKHNLMSENYQVCKIHFTLLIRWKAFFILILYK